MQLVEVTVPQPDLLGPPPTRRARKRRRGIVGMVVDDRVLTGLSIRAKPTKFALSILIYTVTWA